MKKREIIGIRVPADFAKILRESAKKDNRTLSDYIRLILLKHVR